MTSIGDWIFLGLYASIQIGVAIVVIVKELRKDKKTRKNKSK